MGALLIEQAHLFSQGSWRACFVLVTLAYPQHLTDTHIRCSRRKLREALTLTGRSKSKAVYFGKDPDDQVLLGWSEGQRRTFSRYVKGLIQADMFRPAAETQKPHPATDAAPRRADW